jgi:hypothetical protein
MGLFGSIKNKVDCTLKALGTGSKNCKFNIDLINGFYAIKKGTVIEDSDDFNKAFLQGWVQQGIAIPLINAIGFIDNSADDTIQTTQSGVDLKANKGRYKFTLEYKKGEYFNKAMSSLDSFGAYDILLVDESDNFLLTESRTGLGKGFKAGMLNPEKRKWADGTVETTKSITFQLLDRAEQDDRLIGLNADETGFSPEEVDGVNDITLSFVAAPSDTDTTIEIDVISTADKVTALEGLATANFRVLVEGVVTVTTFVESLTVPGRYTGTLAAIATNEVVKVQLWDAVIVPQTDAILVGDDIYGSNELEATVV